MLSYPQFSFWILMPLTEICFFHRVMHKLRKSTFVLVGTVVKKSEYLRPDQDVQNV